jgi:uncharacterized protein YgiM (DUF1202 family)
MLTGLSLIMAAAAAAQCDFAAATADSRYTATNVRAAPSSSAKILRRIGATDPVVVHVVGRRGDWYRVDRIDDAEQDKMLFRGTAWIHRSQLLLSVAGGDHRLRALPLRSSAAIMRLTPDGNALDIIDCKGEWVKVVVDRKTTGWMAPDAQCSNPMTTCS